MEWTLERINKPQSFIVLDNANNTFSCGRNTKNQIICLSLVVSRQHCMFVRDAKTLSVLDLKSSNGIYVNGKLQEPSILIPLQENDVIGIGSSEEYRDNEPMFIYKVHKGNLGARNLDDFDLLSTQQSTSSSASARDNKIKKEEIVIDLESEEQHTLKRNHPSREQTHPSAPKIAKIEDKILVIEDDDDEIFNKYLDKPVESVPKETEETDEIKELWSKVTSSVKVKFKSENPSFPYVHTVEADSTTCSGSSGSNINLQQDNRSTILREVGRAENGPYLTSMNTHSATTNKLSTETVGCVSSKSKRSITAERDQAMIDIQNLCDNTNLFNQNYGTENDANTKKRVFPDKLTNSARCTVINSEPVEIVNIQNKGGEIDSQSMGNEDNEGTLFNTLSNNTILFKRSSITKDNVDARNQVPSASLSNSARRTNITYEPTKNVGIQTKGSRDDSLGIGDEGKKGKVFKTPLTNTTFLKESSGTENNVNRKTQVPSATLTNSGRRTFDTLESTENIRVQNKGSRNDFQGIGDEGKKGKVFKTPSSNTTLLKESSGTENNVNRKTQVPSATLTNSGRRTFDTLESTENIRVQNEGSRNDFQGIGDEGKKGKVFKTPSSNTTFLKESSGTENNVNRKTQVPSATLTNSDRRTFGTLEPTENIGVQNKGSRNDFQDMSDEGTKGKTLSNNPTLSKRSSSTENDANNKSRVSSDTLANSARRTHNIWEPTENLEIHNKGGYIDLRGIKDSPLISKENIARMISNKCDLQRNNSDDAELEATQKPTIPCKTTGRNPLDRLSVMDEIPLAASSPFKEKEIKQDPTTSFSVSDTTNLSDDDEDIFPNSQLFHSTNDAAEFNVDDELFEVKEEQIFDYDSKHEFLDNEEIQDHEAVIILSESEDDENPWLDRLSRSQRIKEEAPDIVEEQDLNDPLLWEEWNEDFFVFEKAEDPQVHQVEKTNLEKDGVHPQSPPMTEGPSIPFLKVAAIERLIGDNGVDHDQDQIAQTSDPLHIESVTADKSGDGNLRKPPSVKLPTPKGPKIIEPLHLPQKRRRSLRDALEQTNSENLNLPSTSSIPNFRVRDCSVELQKLPLTSKQKKQLRMVSKVNQKAYEEEQRLRRIKNKWAQNIPLPVGKRKSLVISKKKKSEIINERKEKLKALAAKQKADNDKPSVERIAAKAKAKVTLKTRGDFLITEQQTAPSTKPSAKSSEAAKSKIGAKSSKSPKKNSKNASKSESVGVTREPTSSASKFQPKKNAKESTPKKAKDEQSNNKKEPSQKLSPNKQNKKESGQKSSPSKQPKKAETPSKNTPKTISARPVDVDMKTIESLVEACLKKKKDQLPNALDKYIIKKKKRVRFSSDLVTVRVFEIDPNNTMKKCVGKDALIPREKLISAKGKVPDETQYPKLEEFFLQIFTWNPSWLEEQRYLQSEPPIVNNDALIPMLTSYRSYKEYYQVMLPLMLIELWQGMTKEFENINKNYRRKTVYCSIVSNSVIPQKISGTNLEMTSMMLEVLASNEDIQKQCHPMFGDLVYVELCYKNDEGKQCFLKVFAYVTNMIRKAITPNTFFNRDLQVYTPKPSHVLTYTVTTRLLKVDICTNRLLRLRCVTYLRSNMRMVQALQYLPKSPLVNFIVNPRIEDYQLSGVVKQSTLITRDALNHKQLEAVFKATETIVRRVPKICLIQGPPGTGKSKVIENIVMQVLYGNNRYKNKEQSLRILLCAPSNAAIDEIVLRLLNRRASLTKDRFKMVRVGMQGPMHPRVREISVEELAKRDAKKTYAGYQACDQCVDSLEDEKRCLEARINAIQMELNSTRPTNMCHVQCLNMKLLDLRAKYNLIKNRIHSNDSEIDSRDVAKLQRYAENKVLIGADIIACTLSSCYANLMESAFSGSRNKITVCIVDEATQSSEAETLIPLMLGVNTLVLVGDPNQLPATVISQKAKQLGLDQSLFARAQNAFSLQKTSPVIMLNMQYRMDPSIAYWPNQFFYRGRLRNALPENEPGLPLHPYRVMDLDSEQNFDKFTNTNEAEFVANLIWSIINIVDCGVTLPILSIAVITPYRNQQPIIQAKINERLSPIMESIQGRIQVAVNTVDSFQGQERDIVVMSCVRSNGIGFLSNPQRLCVALTRAKQCLVLCGNFQNFQRDPMWSALLFDARSRRNHVKINAAAKPAEIIPHLIK